MWKLKVGEGGGRWVTSSNKHMGRQHWEFDKNAVVSEDEAAQLAKMRHDFNKNRHQRKQSADLLMRMQLRKENPSPPLPAAVRLDEEEEITAEATVTTLHRAVGYLSSIQAHDGHWPAESAAPLFFLPPLVMALYITGDLDAVLSSEHRNMVPLQCRDHGVLRTPRIHANVLSLRQQIRRLIAKEDVYHPRSLPHDMLMDFLHNLVEPIMSRCPFSKLRLKATAAAIRHVHYEDETSNYLAIGCVAKELCLLACWVEAPHSEAYKRHLARIPDYLWIAEDGMKLQTFGSQTWDASLAVQSILSTDDIAPHYGPTLRKAHHFLKESQVRNDPRGDFRKMYRHTSKGGWTFSMQDHGWQASEYCTAEALKAAVLLSEMPPEHVGEKIETQCLYDAVNVILSLQSGSGGFPAWEPKPAARWLEELNPLEFAQDFLVERDYVECTSSAIQSLLLFKKMHPSHRRGEIEMSIERAIDYTEKSQEADGSWYGCWGICYTYATFFAVDALVAYGKTYHNCLTLRKACQFLLSKQLPDGGWGESYLSSSNKVYTNLEGNRSNLVQTSWALLSLISAGQAEIDLEPIHRGIRLLINSQMEDGDFPQQEIVGVFFRNCTLNYSSYRNIFPIWAIGKYRRHILL